MKNRSFQHFNHRAGTSNYLILLITAVHDFRYYFIGSCLSYGHSCWGAHGKRSSNDRAEPESLQDRWALFKVNQNEVLHTILSFESMDEI